MIFFRSAAFLVADATLHNSSSYKMILMMKMMIFLQCEFDCVLFEKVGGFQVICKGIELKLG